MIAWARRRGTGVLLIALAACGGTEFDTWARDVCARNDAVDQAARATLPRTDIADDPGYPEKIQGLLAQKQALKQEVDAYEPPFTRAPLQNKLSISLNNSMRYLRALEDQYHIAVARLAELESAGGLPPDPYDPDNVIRSLVSQQAVYQVDPREVLMKRQYEKLYTEVRVELGLEPINF